MKYLFLFILLFPFGLLLPQDDNYYPLAVGNSWQYFTYGGKILTETIYSDSVDATGWRHFKYMPIEAQINYKISPNRDSVIYSNHTLIYKANCKIGDKWFSRWDVDEAGKAFPIERAIVTQTGIVNLYGRNYNAKEIMFYHVDRQDTSSINDRNWKATNLIAEGVGLVSKLVEGDWYTYQLRGCIINGDTTGMTVGINKGQSIIPEKPELFQNYPNPFNPSTKISYNIPEFSHVNLTVYDALGRQIECRVNEYQNAGHYELTFTPGNISSGIYFYRLNAGKAVFTKKLYFLK